MTVPARRPSSSSRKSTGQATLGRPTARSARRVSGDGGETWAEIVGVVGDARRYRLDEAPRDAIYAPFLANSPGFGTTVLVRTSWRAAAARARVSSPSSRRLDPEVPFYRVRSFDDVRSEALASPVSHHDALLEPVRNPRPRHHGDRGRWRDRLRRQPAHPRDRHPHGAGRGAPASVMGMLMRQGMTSVVGGTGPRRRRGPRLLTPDVRRAVRRGADRSVLLLRLRDRLRRRSRRIRLLPAVAQARHRDRSDGGAANELGLG